MVVVGALVGAVTRKRALRDFLQSGVDETCAGGDEEVCFVGWSGCWDCRGEAVGLVSGGRDGGVVSGIVHVDGETEVSFDDRGVWEEGLDVSH